MLNKRLQLIAGTTRLLCYSLRSNNNTKFAPYQLQLSRALCKVITRMRYIILVSVLFILNGCAHSTLENRVCDGFREWVTAPSESSEKSLSFDWGVVDEDSIPFYANMITQGSADKYDNELYEKAAQATHYIELKKYANIVASCLNLRKTESEDGRLSYNGKYRNREVSVVWEDKFCSSEVVDNNGCFTIFKK